MRPPAQPRTTNEAKFATTNPIVRRLISRFFATLREVIAPVDPITVLDAGCGEGETIGQLGDLLGEQITAVDVSGYCLDRVVARHPGVVTAVADVTELPFANDSFELVMCLEVLEHLGDPEAAVAELSRVASGSVVVSVPYEPWFRIGSLLRGKYVGSLGNHPEHVNQFNASSLRALLEPVADVLEMKVAFPWMIARCTPLRLS